MVQDDLDSDPVMLMITTSEWAPTSDMRYLDFGCSNHMIGHKKWLNEFNLNKKTIVKLADSRSLMTERMAKIVIQRKKDKTTLIEDVLFVPNMEFNLLSIGHLVDKGFSVIMEVGSLKLYHKKKIMVLKSTLTRKKYGWLA